MKPPLKKLEEDNDAVAGVEEGSFDGLNNLRHRTMVVNANVAEAWTHSRY